MPLSATGHPGIFPSPGRVSSTGMVETAGAAPAVVGGSVPATVVGAVLGGVVDGPEVDDRRGTVLATVGRVVAGRVVGGSVGAAVGASVSGDVGSVVTPICGATTWAAAWTLRAPPARAAIAHRPTTAAARDTRRCLLGCRAGALG